MNETVECRNDAYGLNSAPRRRPIASAQRQHAPVLVQGLSLFGWFRDSLFSDGSGETCSFH